MALAVKRWLDVSLGVALAAVALPLMVAIGVAIRLESPGPVLFRPTRIGRHGKPFAMFKFRTMVKDAEERLQELAHLNVAEGMIKIPDDPRVTRIGKWLRRYSLDELPQVLNIIAGHMSLVGPRPHDVHELPPVDLEQDPRLSVRPGLTGLWQISARSDPNLLNRIYYDLVYVNGWSLRLDAKILAKTVPVVVMGKGGLVDAKRAPTKVENGPRFQWHSPNGAHAANGTRDSEVTQDGAIESGREFDSSRSATNGTAQHRQSTSAVSRGLAIAAMPLGEEGS